MESVALSLYERLGGENGLRDVVANFYRIMQTDPAAKECLATHQGRDIRESAEKLFMFLSGVTGGPPLYHDKFGHPRLRMRHFPFAISEKESDQWLYCMLRAMSEMQLDEELQNELANYFRQVTRHLQNRDGKD